MTEKVEDSLEDVFEEILKSSSPENVIEQRNYKPEQSLKPTSLTTCLGLTYLYVQRKSLQNGLW